MTRSDQAIDAAMSVTPIEQVSSDRISSVISRLPFAKRARAVRPNDNPHPYLVALPAKAGIPLRADHDRRARSTERIAGRDRFSKMESQIGRAHAYNHVPIAIPV